MSKMYCEQNNANASIYINLRNCIVSAGEGGFPALPGGASDTSATRAAIFELYPATIAVCCQQQK